MSKFNLTTIASEDGEVNHELIEVVGAAAVLPKKYKLSLKLISDLSKKRFFIKPTFEENVDFKLQKICYDDSTPPYDGYCSHCCCSGSCKSEEFRTSMLTEKDWVDIENINKEDNWKALKVKFKKEFIEKMPISVINDVLEFFEANNPQF